MLRKRPPISQPRASRLIQPVSDDPTKRIVDCVLALRNDCDRVTKWRRDKNRRNRQRYFGEVDWSYKQAGMSQETLPYLSTAVDAFGHLVATALLTNPRWFDIEFRQPADPRIAAALAAAQQSGQDIGAAIRGARVMVATTPQQDFDAQSTFPPHPLEYLSENAARRLMRHYLDQSDFIDKFAQAVKLAAIECEVWLKVETMLVRSCPRPLDALFQQAPNAAEVGTEASPRDAGSLDRWQLSVQVIPSGEVWVDPYTQNSPNRDNSQPRWLIHEYEATRADLEAMADYFGIDKEDIRTLQPYRNRDGEEMRADALMDVTTADDTILITEFWGSFDDDGLDQGGQKRFLIANHKDLLTRKPKAAVFPFIRIRPVDFPGTLGRALFDDVGDLNKALEELFNLILDGGIASVHGIKQIRPDYLSDPGDVEDGIPPGMTLAVATTLPPGEKVLEVIATGQVPQDALATLQILREEVQKASRLAEFQVGSIPSGSGVRASAIVSARESAATSLTSISRTLDRTALTPALRFIWETIISSIEWIEDETLQDLVGVDAANRLKAAFNAAPMDLWRAFGQTDVHTTGITEAVEKTRDLLRLDQGTRLAVGVAQAAPALAALGYDPKRIVEKQLRALGIESEEISFPEGTNPLQVAQGLAGAVSPPGQQSGDKQPQGRPPGTSADAETIREDGSEPPLQRAARAYGQTDASAVAALTGRTGRRIQ